MNYLFFIDSLILFIPQNSTVLNYFSSKLNTETFEKTILYVKRGINNWLVCFLQIVQFIMHQHFSFSPCFAIYNAHQSTTIKQNRKKWFKQTISTNCFSLQGSISTICFSLSRFICHVISKDSRSKKWNDVNYLTCNSEMKTPWRW